MDYVDNLEKQFRLLKEEHREVNKQLKVQLDNYSVVCSRNKELKRVITLKNRKIKGLTRKIESKRKDKI